MIPPSYTPATLRCVMPQQADGEMAFAFDTATGTIRLRMTEASVIDLVAGLTEMMAYQRHGNERREADDRIIGDRRQEAA